MVTESRILPVIRRLYDAAIDAEKWPAFLKELASCFDAEGSHLLRVQPNERALTFSLLYGYDQAMLRRYGGDGVPAAFARFERHFCQLMRTDPRIRLVERYPSRPFSCRLSISEAELHRSPIYRNLLRHIDVEYTLGVSIPEEDDSLILLGVFRGNQSTHFKEQEVELLGGLVPYLKQAVTLSEHLARVDFANRTALEALDTVSICVLIVDERAHVMHANAVAKRIIDLTDGISLRNGVLSLHTREADAALQRAIGNAVAQARAGAIPASQTLAAPRPSGNEPFPLLVGTLWGNHLRYGLGRLDRPLAVVFATIPEEPQEAPAQLLRRLFGLTPMEGRLCERLVQGGATVDGIALDLNIGAETARGYLKNVFAKTGVGRQADLVAKILSTPLWVHRNKVR
jgi:DNA-binding CsgD family transcriptional regulator